MTPDQLAAIHRAAFTRERPWSADEFESLLGQRGVHLCNADAGFALSRTIAGESELLTVAVLPDHQGKGIGRRLVAQWLSHASSHAEEAFLEVASDNLSALALYQSLGFTEAGLRKSYYARSDGAAADAALMRRRLTFGHGAESIAPKPESG